MTTTRAIEVYRSKVMKVIVVESIVLHHRRMPFSLQFFGKLEPIAIIVCNKNGIEAVDLEQQQLDVDELTQTVPRLAILIAGALE